MPSGFPCASFAVCACCKGARDLRADVQREEGREPAIDFGRERHQVIEILPGRMIGDHVPSRFRLVQAVDAHDARVLKVRCKPHLLFELRPCPEDALAPRSAPLGIPTALSKHLPSRVPFRRAAPRQKEAQAVMRLAQVFAELVRNAVPVGEQNRPLREA